MRAARQQKLDELQFRKKILVQTFRSILAQSGVEDFSTFEKDIEDGTTTVKSLKDAAKHVEQAQKDAQKVVDETEPELKKLRKDTDTRKQDLREVIGQKLF